MKVRQLEELNKQELEHAIEFYKTMFTSNEVINKVVRAQLEKAEQLLKDILKLTEGIGK